MSKWRQIVTVGEMPMHRTGWRGSWDAIVAAATGNPRRTVNETVTFSMWVKFNKEVGIEIANGQVEIGENNDNG